MNTNVQVKVNGEAVLSKVSRMFNNTPNSLLLELAQNARRAKASRVHFDCSDPEKLVMTHDGLPFKDFSHLFSLGDSGWEDDDTMHEDPAGVGFFITSMFFKVRVESRAEKGTYQIDAGKDELLKIGSSLPVVEAVHELPDDANVRVTLTGEHRVSESTCREMARHFPITISWIALDYQKRVISGALDSYLVRLALMDTVLTSDTGFEVLSDKTYNGVRFRLIRNAHKLETGIYSSQCRSAIDILFNYHGHARFLSNSDDTLEMSSILSKLNLVSGQDMLLITPEGRNGIRMVLPGRHSIVENDAYKQMMQDLKSFLAEEINKLPEHDLSFKHYEFLGGADKIKQEAAVPRHLADLPDDALIITGSLETHVQYAYEQSDSTRLVFFENSRRYDGYSWMGLLDTHNCSSLELFVNGLCIGAFEPTVESGKVQKIQVALHKDYKEYEIITDCPSAFYTDDSFCGCFLHETLHAWFDPKLTETGEAYCAVHQYIMDAWTKDEEGDSYDTQKEEFRQALETSLTAALCPEDLDQTTLTQLVDSYSGCLRDYTHILFFHKDGSVYRAEGTTVKKDETATDVRGLLKDIIDEFDGKEEVTLQMDRIKEMCERLG